MSGEVAGLQQHQVDLEPLLNKMRVGYNPNLKYKGINKQELSTP